MINNFANTDLNLSLLMIFKFLLIALSAFYLVFSFIVIRQISIMKKTLVTPISGKITLIGWIHMGFAISVLLSFLFLVKP